MVIAVRRLACEGCRQALQRLIATRYMPHDTCARFDYFGRLNNWKLVELEASDGLAAEIMADDEDLQVQERTDEMLRLVSAGDYLAMVGEDNEHAHNGYYVPELCDGKGQPLAMPQGTLVVDVIYLNTVPSMARWWVAMDVDVAPEVPKATRRQKASSWRREQEGEEQPTAMPSTQRSQPKKRKQAGVLGQVGSM